MMIMLGEAVGFVADVHQDAKRVRAFRQPDRLAFHFRINKFFPLREREEQRAFLPRYFNNIEHARDRA